MASAVIVVPHGALTVLFEPITQLDAVTVAPPVRPIPVPGLAARANRQPCAPPVNSAVADAGTVRVDPAPSIRANISATLVVTVTCTAWLPVPRGETG